MPIRHVFFVLSLIFTAGCGLVVGCGKTSNGPSPTAPNSSGSVSADAPSAPLTPEEKLAARVEAELSKLSAADQAMARAQKICPVSEAPLGSMAGLQKVSLEGGREVFVCCGGCLDALKADPAGYLAKLDGLEEKAPSP